MVAKDSRKPSAQQKADDVLAQTRFAEPDIVARAREQAAAILARAQAQLEKKQAVKRPRKVLSAEELEALEIIKAAKAEAAVIYQQRQALIGPNEKAILADPSYKAVLEANRIKRPLDMLSKTASIWQHYFDIGSTITAEDIDNAARELKIEKKYAAHWGCQMRKIAKLQEVGYLDVNGNATELLRDESRAWKMKLNAAIVADQRREADCVDV